LLQHQIPGAQPVGCKSYQSLRQKTQLTGCSAQTGWQAGHFTTVFIGNCPSGVYWQWRLRLAIFTVGRRLPFRCILHQRVHLRKPPSRTRQAALSPNMPAEITRSSKPQFHLLLCHHKPPRFIVEGSL
jgi:hypothetical protein